MQNDNRLRDFATRICAWQRRHGRHHLPWQGTRDPYRIWLSEIMLQQTQVATVIPYYERFLARFPDIGALAGADQDAVMPYWAGLGYYARARNLHRCAQVLVAEHEGRFPPHSGGIAQLPGIGRSTAAAIAAFAHGERSPIMDGNVKRVFTRFFGVRGHPGLRAVEQRLWALAEAALEQAPADLDMAAYTQGLMDLGSQVCTRGKPLCGQCPMADGCEARRLGLQRELPEPRPRRAIPDRHCAMLLLLSDGSVLLEKQPQPGIWGGLWSLPRYDSATELADACRNMGVTVTEDGRMATLVHTFTHFRLHIEPWRLEVPHRAAEAPADRKWVRAGQLGDTAVPAPVRSLLDALPAPFGAEPNDPGVFSLSEQ
ncbi:A/G-specific adenine glycosylase [Alcaligenaceae bacterium]|nr:A/G-specific adenine glycosylase [Alcaligenaceae bacterium]